MEPVKAVRNGKTYINYNVGLLVNHGCDVVEKLTEEFVIKGQVWEKKGLFRKLTPRMQTLGSVKLSEFMDMGGYVYFECGFWWPEDSGIDKLQLLYVSKNAGDGPDEIPVTGLLPLEFQYAAHVPKDKSLSQNKSDFPRIEATSPLNGKGRWHLSHRFNAGVDGNNLIYLWRYAVPALVESHSHVMSNHCATLPAIWEKNGLLAMLEPGYPFQDWMGPKVKGEMVSISVEKTPKVAASFRSHLKSSPFVRAFPFLDSKIQRFGCVLPMDMEFMHYLGYEGIPILRSHLGALWYCWNKKWKRHTNNVDETIVDPMGYSAQVIPKPYASEPASVDGESWHYMSEANKSKYSPWRQQLDDHRPLLKTGLGTEQSGVLPLFHFDPRRYCGRRMGAEPLVKPFEHVIPSSTWDGSNMFVGFKLYTAMGWAPMDPLLKTPLADFYKKCESDQIPLMNHCSPAGFYSHDRKFFFDLHKEKGRLAASEASDHEGWPTKFPNWAYTPRNTVWKLKGVKLEPATEKEKIWWYCQHYVAPSSWKNVIKKHPKLKLCFAHFASSDHLEEGAWSGRKIREPESTPHDLTIGFDGPKLDAYRTHSFIYDLFDMIQPENRVFTDLSYVILKTENADNFRRLFDWARRHKPILLERILWGTDWPLIGDEDMAKDADVKGLTVPGFKTPPLLYRYAKGFTEWAQGFPDDFFVRCCFLNPIQFWGFSNLRKKASSIFKCPWLDKIPQDILDNYTGDKVALLYARRPDLFEPLAP